MAISSERLQIQRALGRAPKEDPRFLRRLDGTADYFPDGQDQPGYRLTERNQQWIIEIEQAFTLQCLAGLAALAAALYFGAHYVDDQQPGLAVYADSWVLRLGAAVPAAAFGYRFLSRIRRNQIEQLLDRAPSITPRITESDADSHFARRWMEISVVRRLLILFGAPVLGAVLAIGAVGRSAGTGVVAPYETMVLGGFAAGIGLGYVWLLAKLIRCRPDG